MTTIKDERREQKIKDLAGDFIARRSNRESLITVTNVMLSPDGKRADILVSVLPEKSEHVALLFLNRLKQDFREYLMEKTRLRIIPSVYFSLDGGEKNRQRISNLLETK